MFTVSYLPQGSIPIPSDSVLSAYLAGDNDLLIEYITNHLIALSPSYTYKGDRVPYGYFTVYINALIVRAHLHLPEDRVSSLASILLEVLPDASDDIQMRIRALILTNEPTSKLDIYIPRTP